MAVWLLVLAALAVRLGYLLAVTRRPGFKWIDPDRYSELGSLLAHGESGWRWTLDAVLYLKHVKAPLYPVILSLFAMLPAPYPFSAAVAQAVASAACVGFLFVIGRGLHSARAGFIAALLYAIYLPSIFDVAGDPAGVVPHPVPAGRLRAARSTRRPARPCRGASRRGLVLGLAASCGRCPSTTSGRPRSSTASPRAQPATMAARGALLAGSRR